MILCVKCFCNTISVVFLLLVLIHVLYGLWVVGCFFCFILVVPSHLFVTFMFTFITLITDMNVWGRNKSWKL